MFLAHCRHLIGLHLAGNQRFRVGFGRNAEDVQRIRNGFGKNRRGNRANMMLTNGFVKRNNADDFRIFYGRESGK